eukprot:757543-Hanusia_phi.AAC.1
MGKRGSLVGDEGVECACKLTDPTQSGLRSALVKEEDEKTDPVREMPICKHTQTNSEIRQVRFFPGELSPAMEVIYQMLRIEFMQVASGR